MIAAVFFDGDQTLWDFDKVMRRALHATLVELRSRRPEPATAQLAVESMIADRQAADDGTRLEELRLAGFRRTLTRLRLRDEGLAEHLTSFYLRHRFSDVELYADTLPTLTAARRTYALGLLSNGNTYPDGCGLAEVFSAVVFAQDHGIAKPDRRLFDIAAARIGAEPSATVMVGDSLTHDVTAAQPGRVARHLAQPRRRPLSRSPLTRRQITTLAQLPGALTDLS